MYIILKNKTFILIILSLLFLSSCLFATKENYKELWKEVQNSESKGLPKTTLKIVERIYERAKKEKNASQFVKAVIHKMKFSVQVEEFSDIKIINNLREEVIDSKFPIKPVLHSILADSYWQYFQRNRWKFYNRTETVNFQQDDISTWDLKTISKETIKHFQLSLQNPKKLKKISLDTYNEIISIGNTRHLRPYLYDFLAHRAVDFYINTEPGLIKPAYEFKISDKSYFHPAEEFVKLNIVTADSLSPEFNALLILQDLIKFHLKNNKPDALIDVDLKRLKFVHNKSVKENKGELYETALLALGKKYEQLPASAEISYELANLYFQIGHNYNAQFSEDYRWHFKKAYDLCQETIKRFPKTIGAENCEYLICQITEKNISLQTEKVNLPQKLSLGLLNYKNVNEFYFRVVKFPIEDKEELLYNYDYEKRVKYFLKQQLVKEWIINIPDDEDFQSHAVEIKIPELDLGSYVILVSNNKNFSFDKNAVAYSFLTISNISFVQREVENERKDFYVLHRETGKPLSGVKANVWFREYNYEKRKYERIKHPQQFFTDKEGYFNIPIPIKPKNNSSYYIEFIYKNDRLFTDDSFYDYYYKHKKEKLIRTFFFTDRAIYRPGQTIYFKGIVIETDEKEKGNEIKTGFRTTVTLFDVNYQKVSELNLTTNEYGTFSGNFTIPQGVLTGNFRITNNYGSISISVEEYKRPKFEVKIDPVKESFKVNEIVYVKGSAKAYAGFNIDNADLTYRVVRTVTFPYWWYYWRGYSYYSSQVEITNGKAKTDENGKFEIEFKAIPDLKIPEKDDPTFTYQIFVDVTDINGETRSARQYVYVGYTALRLNLQIHDKINKDEDSYSCIINSQNLNGEFEPAKGDLFIYKLKSPDRIFREKLWQKADKFKVDKDMYYSLFPYDVFTDENNFYKWEKEKTAFESKFDTEKDKNLNLKNLKKWEQGVYLIELYSKDKYGKEVKEIRYFTLYSEKEKNLPYKMFNWFSMIKYNVEPGEKAKFLIGSSADDVKVLYEIEQDGKILKKEWIYLNDQQKLIEILVKEKHRGNFSVQFTFVKHNRLYVSNYVVNVPWTNKQLKLEFETFRDKLLPGEKEEWRIKIKDSEGDKVAAEMLTTLYDASLDAFRANYWHFNINSYYYGQLYWQSNTGFSVEYSTLVSPNWNIYRSMAYKEYDALNWFGIYWYGSYHGKNKMLFKSQRGGEFEQGIVGIEAPTTSDKLDSPGMKEESIMLANGEIGGLDESYELDVITAGVEEKRLQEVDLSAVEARTNFNETAFFYPQLKTNEQGDVIISFTIPEALTKWKMMGLAHTKDLKTGTIQNELVTQKQLMVVPNAPRFLREGDEIIFTAKISNLVEKELEGVAELKLFDAITMQPVDAKFNNKKTKKSFKVKAEQSTLVSWEISIPEGIQAVTYRVVAKAGNFSDGEEKALPILTNRMLVTESLPLPVRGNQTKTFKFDKLLDSGKSKTLRNHKLTLEFTSNPAWYAIQALPYIMEYPYECSEQIFSRLYANSIASHIANSSPKIKRVFDSWKDTPGSKALLSNLEKNQELKALLLEETPWVLDAQNETERKKRVAVLFDLNRMANELDTAIRKLQEAQVSNGGWSWFKGMPDSRYITQHIVTGLGHLDHLNIRTVRQDDKVWNMLKKAVSYLDERIREDYEWLLKHASDMDDDHISSIQIQYLYSRSYFKDIPINDRNEKAFNYFKGQAKKYWLNKSKYMQGMIALALHRYDDKETPKNIIASLKEFSLYSEEMGMYWKDNYAGYYWYQAPIEIQALFIEAFDEVTHDKESVENMKVWLLKQKQTQDWKTTKATVEACYALLLKGIDFLENDKLAEITLGNKLIDPFEIDDVKIEAGTGYFKTSWSANEIKPKMGNVKVINKNDVVAWGALYWQYFEDLDKITPHETPLKLKKQLFREKFSDAGKVIEPVTKKTKLNIGDRIKVRIELRVDRNMEFVHMKDMRASSLEPENVISRYKWQDGLGYYESTRDAATNFFFDYLPKGTYVFEYPLRVTHLGDFSNGITSIQCMYAPEFTSHSEGIRIEVGKK
ncbi:MAG: hypothetical protein KAW92_12680 [Candidatus Cloacimonetes bacterium]|nr:hypothetical protein [Candidatus Cloacimonadota bacterium]